MDIKKTDPSKVIVVPRPPRQANQELRPINGAAPSPDAGDPELTNAPIDVIDPGCGPLNNQVEGPAQGLAGVPTAEPAEEE